MNEDCLYLNIFTPNVRNFLINQSYSFSTNDSAKLSVKTGAVPEKFPVIFYIHGGDFERGASNTFPGHTLAAVGDVVVVTVNYRLGALGTILARVQ